MNCSILRPPRQVGLGETLIRMLVNGGRYRIRTYDFHRVRMALYR
jgi:hypothetical protein